MGIDEALYLMKRSKIDLGFEGNEALDTLCHWVEWKLKQEREEWEAEEEWTRNRESKIVGEWK
jgi:hypothetical protein